MRKQYEKVWVENITRLLMFHELIDKLDDVLRSLLTRNFYSFVMKKKKKRTGIRKVFSSEILCDRDTVKMNRASKNLRPKSVPSSGVCSRGIKSVLDEKAIIKGTEIEQKLDNIRGRFVRDSSIRSRRVQTRLIKFHVRSFRPELYRR